MISEDYVVINSVPTHVITIGKWITDKFDEDKTHEIILIIPGNPGYPYLYKTFCQTIYDELQSQLSIWIIGHAGFCEPPKDKQLETQWLKGNQELYSIEGQLKHKIEFIEKYLPKNVIIHLIGHSMGSNICLELLKISHFSSRVKHCYLLFPVIERVEESRKGKFYPNYDSIFFLFTAFFKFLNILPNKMKNEIVKTCMRADGINNDEYFEAARDFMDPKLSQICWFLMMDMIDKIKTCDDEILKQNIHRLKLYYAVKDAWVGSNFHSDIVARIPELNAVMCDKGFEHAFVFNSSIEVGQMVSKWIKESSNY